MSESVVYFIQSGGNKGPIKIGTSGFFAEYRLAELQVGNPHKLSLLGSCPGDRKLERKIHDRLKTHRIRGEWFKPTREVITEIQEHISFAPADNGLVRDTTLSEQYRLDCSNCGTLVRAHYEKGPKPKRMCRACEEFVALRESGKDPFEEAA